MLLRYYDRCWVKKQIIHEHNQSFINLSSIILWSGCPVIWATHFNMSIMRTHQSTLMPSHLSIWITVSTADAGMCCDWLVPSGRGRLPWGPAALWPPSAINLLHAARALLCLCLSALHFRTHWALGCRDCMNVAFLLILQAARRHLSGVSPHLQLISLEILPTDRLADHRCRVCVSCTTVFFVLRSS